MDERVKEHLKHLNRYYLLLVDIQKIPYEQFMNDPIYQGSAERFLQLAIESCMNIGNRVIALAQFHIPVKTPETYADIFKELNKLGVLEGDFADRLMAMARFRNKLVHLYWDIDVESVYRFVQQNLDDFRQFQNVVVDYLNG